ncbi:hypothetical protein DENSPDRAFT_651538 [Dentipellis sp. KUC8613]|nr:hypothetical protein DENSPDRAFT_651538 [Dentipellis sp. KUC8613]
MTFPNGDTGSIVIGFFGPLSTEISSKSDTITYAFSQAFLGREILHLYAVANPPPSALCSPRLPLGRCRRLDGGVAMSVFAVRMVFPRICHGSPLCPTERSIQWLAAQQRPAERLSFRLYTHPMGPNHATAQLFFSVSRPSSDPSFSPNLPSDVLLHLHVISDLLVHNSSR